MPTNLQRVGRCEKSATGTFSSETQPEIVEQLERGRMDRVAAKIAKEIRVLFEQEDIDAGARQKKSRHHAGWPAAGDAAAGRQSLGRARSAALHAKTIPRSRQNPKILWVDDAEIVGDRITKFWPA